MAIAVGTSTVVCYTEVVRYWDGPLSEVPLYTMRCGLRSSLGTHAYQGLQRLVWSVCVNTSHLWSVCSS